MKELNNILLIDDDFETNYFHEIYIKEYKIAKNVITADNGQDALDLLFKNKIIRPEIILLDLNMPIMNGWEFLEEYSKLRDKNASKIIMMTSSIDPLDETKGKTHPYILDYITKPLNKEKLAKIAKYVKA